jgi:hypothetical protein
MPAGSRSVGRSVEQPLAGPGGIVLFIERPPSSSQLPTGFRWSTNDSKATVERSRFDEFGHCDAFAASPQTTTTATTPFEGSNC